MTLRKLRRHIASVAALLIGITGLGTIAAAAPASAATGCSVAYAIQSDWGQGFVVNITITNLGSPITNWTLSYSYTGNQALANGWNGNWSQSGKTITVTNASYNGSLATGGTAVPGAQFAYSGTNVNPTAFTLNGTACTGQTNNTGSLVVSPTAQNITQGHTGTVGITLSAAPTANVTVSTALTSGNSGLSATAGTSLTFTPSNFSTPQNVTITANSSGTGQATFTVSASGYTSVTFTATETVAQGNPTIVVSPTTQTITQGGTGTVGISLSSAPTSNVTVTTAFSTGNNGLSVTGGSSLTFTSSNFGTAQNVTITANSSGSGQATFTASATGLTTVTFSATEAAACTSNCGHVADPFTGSKPYLNPDYVKEVQAQATADGSAAEARVASFQTAIWLDTISAISGGGSTGRTGLMQQLTNAAAAGTAATPSLVEIVIYDLPGRDCAALASNGEIPATAAGLTEYESQYIDPIASILNQFASSPIRVVAIIEPDSLPNVVTNQSMAACQTASTFYEQGITYALNKLHAIGNVYNYMDIAHSAWLGWPNNMNNTPAVYNTVVKATTAGYASIDGFISDTANYTPTQEPLLTNPTLQVGGQQIDAVTFYQSNPTFDELTYDTNMYNTLVNAGFPATKRFLIDTSRNGWGPTHPTTITQASDATTYVNDNKIDQRPFRGDWCNQNNAGIGARPTDEPFGTSSPIEAFVWIKPPGESDGDYPTSTHTHGDPHCDPSKTNTDGNGNQYPTGSIPGFDVAAGQWFAAEFQMLVRNAFPAM